MGLVIKRFSPEIADRQTHTLTHTHSGTDFILLSTDEGGELHCDMPAPTEINFRSAPPLGISFPGRPPRLGFNFFANFPFPYFLNGIALTKDP